MLPLLDDLVQAHGVGGQKDLPISLPLAISGAMAALVVSFTILAVAWRTPRYDAATSGRPAPQWLDGIVGSAAFRGTLRLVGFVLFAYTAFVAVAGQDLFINPIFGLFYVVLWVGVVFASVVVGPLWKAISPVRTINLAFAKLSGSDPTEGCTTIPNASATGRRPSASTRSCGWSWSTRFRPSWHRSGSGAPSTWP